MRTNRVVTPAVLLVLGIAASAEQETSETWAKWSHARAEKLQAGGEYDEAIEEWLVLAQLRPMDVEPLSRAAVLAVEMSDWRGKELSPGSASFKLAQRCIREAVPRWGRGDPGIAYAVGRLNFAEKQYGPAWQTLGEAAISGFDPVRSRLWLYKASVNRAVKLIDNNRGAEVVAELEALRKSQPDHPDEHFLIINLAAAHKSIQQPSVATKLLEDEIARNPGSPEAHYILGMILADEGRLDDAEKQYRETMLHASAANVKYRDSLLRLCDLYIKMNRLDDAERAADQYGSIARDDADGLFAQGRVALAKNDLEKAVRLLRRAARLAPDTFDTLVGLQKALYQLGESKEADVVGKRIDEIRKAKEESSGSPGPMQPAQQR